MVNWNLFIRKWDNFFILAPLILIQLRIVSRLINEFKYSYSNRASFWFDENLKEIVIFPNRVNWNLFILKWDNFFILAPLILIQLHSLSRLINESKYSFSNRDSLWFD